MDVGRTAMRKRLAGSKHDADEAVVYAVGHRIRIEALSLMNERKTSPNEIAEFLNEDLPTVSHHIRELFRDGSIESAGTVKRRNATEHFYRAVTLPYVSTEEYQAMTPERRREIAGLIVQAIMAETLAALRLGKMQGEREPWLTWQPVMVDQEGEEEVDSLAAKTYAEVDAIKVRNANRIADARKKALKEGKEPPPPGKTQLVILMTYERSREGRPVQGYPPLDLD